MIILGLDPGMEYTGYGIIKYDQGYLTLICCGRITTKIKNTMQDRLKEICSDIDTLIEKNKPDLVAIEGIFSTEHFPMAAVSLGRVIGAITNLVSNKNLIILELLPKEIKKAVTGNGNASKEQVRDCVMVSLGAKGIENNKTFHTSDAIAVAITAAYRS